MNRTVWLLTSGSYSDYSVSAVLTSKEECQRVIDEDKRISGASWSNWNDPEECILIEDAGVPSDVLAIRAYHGNPENQETHTAAWGWEGYHSPLIEGTHITMEDFEKRNRAGYGLGQIAAAVGTNHEQVRKAFSERRAQALAFLTSVGKEVPDGRKE
jgi:hypothetical protein